VVILQQCGTEELIMYQGGTAVEGIEEGVGVSVGADEK